MYCSKCGNEIKKGEQFCPQCGNKAFDDTVKTNKQNSSAANGDSLNKKILVGLVLAVSGLVLVLAVLIGVLVQGRKSDNGAEPESWEENGREYTPMVQCMACNGTGKITCHSCLGSGTETIIGSHDQSNDWLGEKRPCSAGCRGTGKVDCEYCDGTGWR